MRAVVFAAAFAAFVAAPASAADAPYIGDWECEGYGSMSITATTYDFGERTEIADVTRDGPAYILTMADGYTVAVAVQGGVLNWFSPESGDSFDCRRAG